MNQKIKTWDEADAALKEIGDLRNWICAEEDLAAVQIRKLEEATADKLRPRQAFLTGLETALKNYCDQTRGQVPDSALSHGKVGFFHEPIFAWPKKVSALILRLRECKLDQYLVEQEPKPDKRGIMAHHEELPLKDLGVKRTIVERFRYQLKDAETWNTVE